MTVGPLAVCEFPRVESTSAVDGPCAPTQIETTHKVATEVSTHVLIDEFSSTTAFQQTQPRIPEFQECISDVDSVTIELNKSTNSEIDLRNELLHEAHDQRDVSRVPSAIVANIEELICSI
jgi:hypothetical protein